MRAQHTRRGAIVHGGLCTWPASVLRNTGGKRIFLGEIEFVGSRRSASRKSLKPHKYFVSSFRRWLVRFGFAALFADQPFLRLFFVFFFASVTLVRGASRSPHAESFFFNRPSAVPRCNFRLKRATSSEPLPFVHATLCRSATFPSLDKKSRLNSTGEHRKIM